MVDQAFTQKKEQEHLLGDLESIKDLLDMDKSADHKTPPADLDDIPVLKSFVEPMPEPSSKASSQQKQKPAHSQKPTEAQTETQRVSNQEQQALDRLNSSQQLRQLSQTLNKYMPSHLGDSPNIDRKLREQANLLAQEVVDEFIPIIETTFRQRLEAVMDDFFKKGD